MFYIAQYHASAIYKWNKILTRMSSYDVISETLKELDAEPTNIKYTVTALCYIQEKTGLSRSYILKVLADLKRQKHISLHRGVLVGNFNSDRS